MDQHRIFVIGDSLFADSVTATMRHVDTVHVVGTAPSIEAIDSWLSLNHLDLIIVAGTTGEDSSADFGSLVARFPHLPIIRTTLNTDQIQITTSQCVGARLSDLLEVIATLPKRR